MKKIVLSLIVLLLFFLLFSCTNPNDYYKKGEYENVLESLNNKKRLSKSDYNLMANTLVQLNRYEEAADYALIYLLLSDSSVDDRAGAIAIYLDSKYRTDTLSVVILNDKDGIPAKDELIKARYNLTQGKNE